MGCTFACAELALAAELLAIVPVEVTVEFEPVTVAALVVTGAPPVTVPAPIPLAHIGRALVTV